MNYIPRSPQVPIYMQIKQFVQSLSSKKPSQKTISHEVQTLLNQLGVPAEQFFLIQLMDQLEFPKDKSNPTMRGQFLASWLPSAIAKSHFLDYFSGVIETVCQSHPINEYLTDLCVCLKIPLALQMMMFLSLTLSSNSSIYREGVKLLKKKLHEYFQQGRPHQFPSYALHIFIYQLRSIQELNDQEAEVKFFLESIQGSRQQDMKPLFEDQRKQSAKWIDQMPLQIDIPKISECLKPLDILKELGPSSCTPANLNNCLADFLPLQEDDIMECILYMAENDQVYDEIGSRDVVSCFNKTSLTYPDWESIYQEPNNDRRTISSWDIDSFFRFCQEKNPKLQWKNVIERLDRPNLYIKDQQMFINLMNIINKLKGDKVGNFQFPSRLLLDKWSNRKSQITFFSHMLKVGKPDLVFWSECASKKLIAVDNLKVTPIPFWNNLDFFQLMIELSDSGYIVEVRELFEQPLKSHPELMMMGLFQIQPQSGGALIDELFTTLFPTYVSQHANSSTMLECMWKYNQTLFIAGISELYRKELGKKENSCLNLSRVLDIVQQLFQNSQHNDSLLVMARFHDYHFAVPLGILASKREYLNFDHWMQERIKTQGVPFVQVLLQYIEENVLQSVKEQQAKQNLPPGQLGQMKIETLDQILDKVQLKIEMITIIFEQLNANADKLGNKIKQQSQQFYKELLQVFPQLAGPANQKQNQEIENKTDEYFNKYYADTLNLDTLLSMMSQWKTSGTLIEKEVFSCIITNLYNEYQYHTKYPHKELMLTGQLFGAVLERGFVEGKSLSIGLEMIRVSVRSSNNRYEFAIKALEMMKEKIHEWPKFAQDLIECETLQQRNAELLQEIIKVCERNDIKLKIPPNLIPQPVPTPPPISAPTTIQPPAPAVTHGPIQVTPVQIPVQQPVPIQPQPAPQVHQKPVPPVQNPGTQVHSQSVTPPPPHHKSTQLVSSTPQPNKRADSTSASTQMQYLQILNIEYDHSGAEKNFPDMECKERITFLLNQVTNENLEKSASEIRPRLEKPECYQWFLKNFSLSRAPKIPYQQQQVSTMYNFFQALNRPRVFTDVAREISIALSKILNYRKANPGAEDRNTLKNLGSLLGQVTILRNKPFLYKYFHYKELLDKTTVTIYPLCKILEWCSQSMIFNKNNRWISHILQELSRYKESVQSILRYEIINLLKSFDVSEIQPQPTIPVPETRARTPIIDNPRTPAQEFDHGLNIKTLPNYIAVDSKYLCDQIKESECKSIIAQALDKAISEIIPPVISRSVTIALITTRELVFKDFALEPNERLMLRGMHMIASHLSGSLAMVTCREPLKAKIQTILKDMLSQRVDEKVKEQIIQGASQDNLDLGCALIKKAVIEKALEEVNNDPHILQELEKRQQFKEQGIPYRDDQAILTQQMLPDQLRAQQEGLTEDEKRIYEEFGTRRPQKSNSLQRAQQLCQQLQDVNAGEKEITPVVNELFATDEGQQFYKQLAERFLDTILFNNMGEERINAVLTYVNQLIQKITSKLNMKWSEITFQFLESSLDKCDNCPLFWQAIPIMLKRKLIPHPDTEKCLLLIISKEQPITLRGVVQSLRQILFTEDHTTIKIYKQILKKLSDRKELNEVSRFLQDLTAHLHSKSAVPPPPQKNVQDKLEQLSIYQQIPKGFEEQVRFKLHEWYKIKDSPEVQHYIEREFKDKRAEELFQFFLYALELSMTPYGTAEILDHSEIVQLGKLVVILAKIGVERIVDSFLKATQIFITKLHLTKEQSFNQRPIFKILYNLLFDFNQHIFHEAQIHEFHEKMLQFLEKIEPNLYPGFAFAWLELLTNRFILNTLHNHQQNHHQQMRNYEQTYARLIVKLLEFLRENFTDDIVAKNTAALEFLKGILRFFMILLEDFLPFMTVYAFQFADEVPFTHLQLLNLCLGAYTNQKIDPPSKCSNIYDIQDTMQFGEVIHAALEDGTYTKTVEEIRTYQMMKDDELKEKLNSFTYDPKQRVPLQISALFLVLPRLDNLKRADLYNILTRIIRLANQEVRTLLLNVLLNQLRYPEKSTEFYLKYVLNQYMVNDNQQIQDLLLKLITKRLQVVLPIPWGLQFIHEDLMRTNNPNNLYQKYYLQQMNQAQ